jgi:hypothetical protein
VGNRLVVKAHQGYWSRIADRYVNTQSADDEGNLGGRDLDQGNGKDVRENSLTLPYL